VRFFRQAGCGTGEERFEGLYSCVEGYIELALSAIFFFFFFSFFLSFFLYYLVLQSFIPDCWKQQPFLVCDGTTTSTLSTGRAQSAYS
jgi:hypothetical protein